MEVATGLVTIQDRFGVEEQQVTPAAIPVTAVVAAADINFLGGALVRPVRQNGVFIVDNAWVELYPADASGQLQVLHVDVTIQAGLAVPNQGLYWAHGMAVQIPPTNTFNKGAAVGDTLTYGFEFPPIRESLLMTRAGVGGGRDNLMFQVIVAIRNLDAANPHSFSGNAQIWHRSAYSIG